MWPANSLRHFRRLPACLLLVLAFLAPVRGQDVPPQDGRRNETTLREQTIYIPYAKLRAMFEKEGRGVFLPYEKFQELWTAARAAAQKIEEIRPPLCAVITEIDSTAAVQKDVVVVSARVTIDLLTEGWHKIPLRLTDSAIRAARIGDEPARIVFDPAAGYELLYEKKGKDAERVVLNLEYAKAYSKAPGANTVSFDAPQAPVNRWQIVIGEPGVKVQVTPNLSSTEAAPMAAEAPMPDGKETRLEAFVGAAPQVRIDWNPKAEGAAGLEAIATVQVRQEVIVDEGVMRTRAHLAYDISRADLKTLSVEVPADQNVVNVFDPNVQKWEKKVEGPIQTITIHLFQPARGSQNVTIELEKFSDDREMQKEMGRKDFIAPEIKVLGVGRQQGIVVSRLAASLRGEVTTRSGLAQIDPADLPAPLAGQEWPFAYRYAALPYSLVMSVEKVRPEIHVEQLVEAYLEPQQMTLDLVAVYDIQKAGVFQLELDVPEGFEIRRVQGTDGVSGAMAAAVDSYHLDEVQVGEVKQKTRLVVNLSRRALGKVALFVEVQKRQEDPNLLSPTGMVSTIPVSIPRVAPERVARATGRLIVYAPESLRVSPKEIAGLRGISVAEALAGLTSMRQGRFGGTRELLAYAYTQDALKLSLDAERRKPYVSARQLVLVNVEPGVAKYEVTLLFDVLYSGIKSLRVNISEDFYSTGQLRLPPGPIKETRLAEAPEGFVALELTGDGEFLGSYQVKFVGERKLPDFQVGASVQIEVPRVRPTPVDRTFGQIAIAKAETIDIDVAGAPQGLRPIDPQRDLIGGISFPAPPAQAMEFTSDEWTLALSATRYDLQTVKRTSIDRAVVRMVVTRAGETTVQCLFRLRSTQQRLAVTLPPNIDRQTAFDRNALRVNGAPAPIEKGAADQDIYIPLVGTVPDQHVLVELRYTLPGTHASLELPAFADDPAVQQVYLVAYLPQERRLLGVRGQWTDEQHVAFFDQPAARSTRSDEELLQWVREGTPAAGATEPFPDDGRRYLFSALRPEPGAAGALSLVAVHKYVLYTAIVMLVAGVGIVLTRRPIGQRLWWLAGLVVAIVLSAVFAPTLAGAVLGDVFWVSLTLVLVVWLAQFLVWLVPKLTARLAAEPARAAAVATAVAAAAAAPTAVTSTSSAAPASPEASQSQTNGGSAHPPPPSSTGENPFKSQEGGESHG